MSSRGCADGDGERRVGEAYADASCSEEDSSVLDSDDLRLRQQQQRRQDRRDQQLESEYEDDEENFDDYNEEEEEEEENLSRNPSSSAAHASMHKLQSSLQIHDNSLGRCMHEGDDEGRPPATKRPRTSSSVVPVGRGNNHGDDEDDDDDDEDDDDGDGPQLLPPPPPPPPASASGHSHAQSWKKLKRCWLCTFANCKMAKQVSEFVSTNAGVMDPAIMAEQIRQEVSKEYPRAKGIGKRHIMRHIREHMLVPGVRMAGIVRSLISLAETLRCTLQQVDDDTGDLVVDIRNTELYLKVVTQITHVYKMDSQRLLFQNGIAPSFSASLASSSSSAQQQQQQHQQQKPSSSSAAAAGSGTAPVRQT